MSSGTACNEFCMKLVLWTPALKKWRICFYLVSFEHLILLLTSLKILFAKSVIFRTLPLFLALSEVVFPWPYILHCKTRIWRIMSVWVIPFNWLIPIISFTICCSIFTFSVLMVQLHILNYCFVLFGFLKFSLEIELVLIQRWK